MKADFATTIAMAALLLASVVTAPVQAAPLTSTAKALLAQYRSEISGFAGFSAERGRTLYYTERTTSKGETLACASCHGKSPTGPTEHYRTGRRYDPLAPSANPKRFTDAREVEKWFRRNCDTVLERACTPQEKGDYITWLFTR